MAQRKPYNPNTAYGRRKIREQQQREYDNLPQEEKDRLESEDKTLKFWIYAVFIILGALMAFLVGGWKSVLKWFSH